MPWIQLYCNLFLAHSAAEQDMIYLLLTALLSLTSSGIVLSQNIELVLSPDSRLLPVGKNATFTCKFRNVNENYHPFWKINQTEASNASNRGHLMRKGFNILDDQDDINRITTLTLIVNSSYAGVNNTRIQCRTLTHVHSQIATILTIADPPFSPNPLLEQPSSSILSLKWSPPFLWPGYYIRNYNINVRDDSREILSTYQVHSTIFVMTLPLNETYHICMEFNFAITPEHQDIAGQSRYVKGGYYAPLGEFDISAIVFFGDDGTPLVRALVKICSYQELSIEINITDGASNALVTNNGPLPHRGNGSFEYDIISSNLRREMEYFMTVTVYTGFESSTLSYSFITVVVLFLACIIVTVVAVAYRRQKLHHRNQETPQVHEEPYDRAVSRLPQTEHAMKESPACGVLTK